MRGAIIWVIWIRRNACIFNNAPWSPEQLDRALWDAVLDLGRTSWAHVEWQAKFRNAFFLLRLLKLFTHEFVAIIKSKHLNLLFQLLYHQHLEFFELLEAFNLGLD